MLKINVLHAGVLVQGFGLHGLVDGQNGSFAVAASEAEPAVSMVGYHHNERMAVAACKIERYAARLVESQIIGQHAHRIVAVRCPVYFTSFKVSAKADTEEVQNEETLINPQTIGSGFGANLEDDYTHINVTTEDPP